MRKFFTKLAMGWHYVHYQLYKSVAEFYLGLEHVKLIFESDLFWTVSENFERYYKKADLAWFYYTTELKELHRIAA